MVLVIRTEDGDTLLLKMSIVHRSKQLEVYSEIYVYDIILCIEMFLCIVVCTFA